MDRSFRSGLILLVGLALDRHRLSRGTRCSWRRRIRHRARPGRPGAASPLPALRRLCRAQRNFGSIVQQRRGEIALYTLGVVGILVAIAYLSLRFPARIDMTEQVLLAVAADGEHARAAGEAGAHHLLPRSDDARDRGAVRADGLKTDKITRGVLRSDGQSRTGADARGRVRRHRDPGERGARASGERSDAKPTSPMRILRISQRCSSVSASSTATAKPDPFSLESHDHTRGRRRPFARPGRQTRGARAPRHGQGAQFARSDELQVEKVALSQTGVTARRLRRAGGRRGRRAPAPADRGRCRPEVHRGRRQRAVHARSVHDHRTGARDPQPRRRARRQHRDRRCQPFLVRPVRAGGDRLQPAPDHAAICRLSFFPGARSLSPTPSACPAPTVRPLVNSSKRSYGETTRDRAEFTPGKDMERPAHHHGCRVATRASWMRRSDVRSSRAARRRQRPRRGGDERRASASPASSWSATPTSPPTRSSTSWATASCSSTPSTSSPRGKNLIGIEPRTFDLPRVNLTNRQMKGTFFLSVILIPALLALIGTTVWWRQR